jgi:putative transposase
MKRFKSAGQAQRFLAAHDQINNLFHLSRDHVPASEYRATRTQAFQTHPIMLPSLGLKPDDRIVDLARRRGAGSA